MRRSAILLNFCIAALLQASSSTTLRYSLAPHLQDGRLTLRVVVDIAGIQSDSAELVVPSSWGNATGLTAAVTGLRAESPGLSIVETADPAKKLLTGLRRGRARFSYTLIQDWEGPLRESTRHRPHLDPNYVEVNTHNALVYPKLDQSSSVDCRFEWKLLPKWTIATSFGSGASRQKFHGAWDKVLNAVFVAGDFRILRFKMGKGKLIMAIRGDWNASDDRIASEIVKVLSVEREFWKDNDFSYYLVTLVPFGPGQSDSGGGGFTNALSLHASRAALASGGFLSLVAHEVFHAWNPYKIGRIRSPAESIYWFTEGFTMYYQDRLLWLARLLSFDDYVGAVNRIIRDYYASPARNATLRELIDRAREDQVKSRISYERGALIALWLDSKIRQNTQSASSLDSLMFDLYREASRRRKSLPDLTSGRIFQAASRYIGPEEMRQLRSYVELGSTVEAPPEALAPCAMREMVETPTFQLGMDRSGLVDKHLVIGLQAGSEAQKAGLREGDLVVGTSVYWNDTSQPVKLTVRRNQSLSDIKYYARGPSAGPIPTYIRRYDAKSESCKPANLQ